MTVAELIEHLKTLPQGHVVVYRTSSDMYKLQLEGIRVGRAVRHHNLKDAIRDYNEQEWKSKKKVWICEKCYWWANYERHCPHCGVLLKHQAAEPRFVDVVELNHD